MIPILMSAQMREADRRAIEELGISGLVLMENAARGACDLLGQLLDGFDDAGILVLCGKGNNGGDGLALSRHALNAGAEVTCVLLEPVAELSPDAAAQYHILEAMAPGTVIEWGSFISFFADEGYDAIVDAMLGTGAKGALGSVFADAVAWSNDQDVTRMAIDIPTGVDADTGAITDNAFFADATATMGALKPGLLLGEGADMSGDLYVVDIGAPPRLYANSGIELLDVECAAQGLPEIERGRNKYDRGKVLVVAGSPGMTGAAVMAAEASLRAGAGLTVLGAPASALAGMPQHLAPEIMTVALASTPDGALASDALAGIDVSSYGVVAVGPGLGRSAETVAAVQSFVRTTRTPVVLDADGINAFAGAADLLADRACELVITPHHGEMARLLGINRDDVSADPIATARRAASRLDCIVVLKGAPSVVASRDGRAWINAAGNPAMATGGTGDVLTGTIAALLAQTSDHLAAVLTGTYLHSHAADLATEQRSIDSLTATDIIAHLHAAYRSLDARFA